MNLIKPPSILDDILSQDSQNFTQHSQNRSLSNKRGRKENTLKFNQNPPSHVVSAKEHDAESMHSNASSRSKGKKTKQNSLTRPKILNSPKAERQDDSHSVHSNASKNSHKATNKVNTIMPRPKQEPVYHQKKLQHISNVTAQPKGPSFKDAWKGQEESIINTYELSNKKEPSRNQEPISKGKNMGHQTKPAIAKFSPFVQIQQHNYSDEEPVIKLQEPKETLNRKGLVVGAKKVEEKPLRVEERRQEIDESNVIFGQSKLRATKSRRRNIFEKSVNDNTSRVSNSIAESSASGLDETGRKSKSRLRQLFNSSRQKKDRQSSRDYKESQTNLITVEAPLESREIQISRSNFKPLANQNDRLVQLERKVLEQGQDDFSLDESKSELNLSASHNAGRGDYRDRDSVVFHFQTEKRKGMSVTSKQARYQGKDSDMVDIKNKNLVSMRGNPKEEANMIKVDKELVSQQLEGLHNILMANDEYLKQNQFLKKVETSIKRPIQQEEPQVFTLDDSDEQVRNGKEKPWYQVVQNYQPSVEPIKTVKRNEVKLNKDSEQSKKEQQQVVQAKKKAEWERQKQNQREERQILQERRKVDIKKQKEEKQLRDKERMKREQQKRRQREQYQEQLRIQQLQQEEQKQRRERQKAKLQRKRQLRQQEQKIIAKQLQQQEQRIADLQRQRLAKKQRHEQPKRKDPKVTAPNIQAAQKISLEQQPLEHLNAIISGRLRQDSEARSDQSNKSSKKANRKKQNSIGRTKPHKVYVRNQSPRAEESFYEQSIASLKEIPSASNEVQKVETKKQPKLIAFSDQDQDYKPKSKTDMNFYDPNRSQKSFKPPSSKPPLSKRTNGSAGSVSRQKKPKQSIVPIKLKDQMLKNKKQMVNKGQKKMTLMERALQKHNESNDSYSEGSYRERQDFSEDNSRRSNSSKNSRGSFKKESTLNISLKDNQMIHSKYGKDKLQRKYSRDSSHQDQMMDSRRHRQEREVSREHSRQKLQRMKGDVLNERVIVSKNCTFIDQKGRLVQKDMVIKGKDVYGVPEQGCSNQMVMDRMRRSREDKRKRSTSRQRKLSRKGSRDGSENQSNQGSSYHSSTFYDRQSISRSNTFNGLTYTGYGNSNPNPLRQFIRPVQEVPNYNKTITGNVSQKAPQTLNQMFPRKVTVQAPQLEQSRSRRSLKRTERSGSRRG